MSAKLVPVNGSEAIRKLQRAGFEIVKVKGNATYLRNPITGRYTSVHVHGSKDVPTGTLRAIIRQAGLTVEEFNNL